MPTYLWILSALSAGTCFGFILGGSLANRATEDELRDSWVQGYDEGWGQGFGLLCPPTPSLTESQIQDGVNRVMKALDDEEAITGGKP